MKKLLLLLLIFSLTASPCLSNESVKKTSIDLNDIEVLDLHTAQLLAIQTNPGIRAAEARLAQAKAAVKQAAAAFWPSVDATASLGSKYLSDAEFEILQRSGASDQSYDLSSAGLQATWVLFDGFLRKFQLKQLEFAEKSSLAAHKDSQRLLLSAVAKAFLNSQFIQTRIKIAGADKEFYQQQLRDATNRFEIGTGSKGAVLNFKVQLNSAISSLLANNREYEASTYGLAALLALPHGVLPKTMVLSELDKDYNPDINLENNIQSLIDEAMNARPDLRALTMQSHQVEAIVEQTKSAYWPKISLQGNVQGASQGNINLSSDELGGSISLNAAWNLYSAGADKARVEEAKQKQREIVYSLDDLRNQVASEIQQEVALLKAALEQVDLQRESVKLVEENRQLAQSDYDAGAASLVRLNEAQRDLTNTYGRLAQALVNYQLTRQRLLAATGRNLELISDLQGK